MNQDQLQKARQSRWRQDGNALLTLDDAERWLAETPLCLYLPRFQHLPVPAPSFVEAIAGQPDPTPAPDQIAAASQMLARLVASGAAIALNLFGIGPGGFNSGSGMLGEQPDFLATPEALPYLYALQPQRNPKRPPTTTGGARVSPLAAEAFEVLTRDGALTAPELREHLGREVTEAATLRALGELWHSMRVVPVPDEHGAPAHWELLNARHGRELNIGSTQSQTSALSILVSFYLQSTIAASEKEAELFLSPLAPRSRIRDVIHGLSATRQLASFPLNGEAQLYVEGTLPEVPEEAEAMTTDLDAGLEQNEPSFREAAAPAPAAGESRPVPRRPSFGDRARGRSAPRQRAERGERPARREGGFERPQRERGGYRRPAEGAPSAERAPRRDRESPGRFERPRKFEGPERPSRPFDKPKRSFGQGEGFQKRGASSERPPRRDFSQGAPARPPRTGERPPFRREGERRPFNRGGNRPPFAKDRPARPYPKREGEGAEGRPPRIGERPPFRREGERRSFNRGGNRPPFAKDRPARPYAKRESEGAEGRPPRTGERPPFRREGERRPFNRGASRPPFAKDRPARPYAKRESEGAEGRPPRTGERPPFRREGERRSFNRGGNKPPFAKDRPARPYAKRESGGAEGRPPRREGDRPYKRPYAPSGERPARRGPGSPAESDRPRRPFPSKSAGVERGPFRREGERPSRPGGFQKPGVREGGFSRPTDRPRAGGFKSRQQGAESGGPSNFRKPTGGNRSFGKPRPFAPGKPGGRPPAKGLFRPGKPGGKRFDNRRAGDQGRGGKRPGGSAPPSHKPRKDSGEGDEG